MSAMSALVSDMQRRMRAIHADRTDPLAVEFHVAAAVRELAAWEADMHEAERRIAEKHAGVTA